MSLRRLQQSFKQALLEGNTTALAAQINPHPRRSHQQSIAVHQNNLRGGLVNALKQIYPSVRHYLGKNYFSPVARGYIATHPSHNQDLNFYGQDFPEFIAQLQRDYPELAAFGFLYDLAVAEKHCHQAYYAEDSPAFDFPAFAEIAAKDPAQIYFRLAPGLFLLTSVYQLKALVARTDLTTALAAAEKPLYYCISRQAWQATVEPVEESVWNTLQGIQQSLPLSQLAEMNSELDQHLPKLIERQWVCSFAFRSKATSSN